MAKDDSAVRVIRSSDRWHWRNEWLESWQSFPVTGNFDLAGNAHGLLMVHNEDTVDPGEGFDAHTHRNTEIITWVLEGTVVHKDSLGNLGEIRPGIVQRMSAGTGITHSERNGAGRLERQQLHVIQMWIPPDEINREPSYQQSDLAADLDRNTLVPIASGMPRYSNDAAISIGNRYATLHVAVLDPGHSANIPDALYGHVFVARGQVDFEGQGLLQQGDAVRLTRSGGHRAVATSEGAELLVWEMYGTAINV